MSEKFKLYFVYKLRLKGSPFFYIGVTCDIDQRTNQHFSEVNRVIREVRAKKSRVLVKLPCYIIIAKQILKRKRIAKGADLSFRYLVVEVIEIFDTPMEASALEGELLKKYKGRNGFLNTSLISAYCEKNKGVRFQTLSCNPPDYIPPI